MIRTKLFIALLVAAVSSLSYGTVFFQNNGTKEGWPNFPQTPQAKGTISDVNSPVFEGATAIKFTQTWIPHYSGRYHSEVVFFNSQKTGDDRFYGLTVYLQPNWVFAADNISIQQWAGDGPWIIMEIRGHNLVVLPHVTGIQTIAPMPAGQWVRIVTHLRSSRNGIFEVWVNGLKRLSLTGNFTPNSTSGEVRWSAGEYVTGWTGKMTQPSPSFRQLFQDHYRIASTEAEAEPANWTETAALHMPNLFPNASSGQSAILSASAGAGSVQAVICRSSDDHAYLFESSKALEDARSRGHRWIS